MQVENNSIIWTDIDYMWLLHSIFVEIMIGWICSVGAWAELLPNTRLIKS